MAGGLRDFHSFAEGGCTLVLPWAPALSVLTRLSCHQTVRMFSIGHCMGLEEDKNPANQACPRWVGLWRPVGCRGGKPRRG